MTNGVPQTLATRGGRHAIGTGVPGKLTATKCEPYCVVCIPTMRAAMCGQVRLTETGGWDFGKFHLRHALERPKYPLCGCEVISCFPRTDFARQSRTRTVVPAVQVQRSAADGIAWVEPMICHELTGMGVGVLGSHTNSSCMAYFVSLVRIATNVHGNGACHARMWQYLQHAMTEAA